MGKSVTPPTFFRRTIGDLVQLSPTPIGDPVQLFCDPCELHPVIFTERGDTRPVTSSAVLFHCLCDGSAGWGDAVVQMLLATYESCGAVRCDAQRV